MGKRAFSSQPLRAREESAVRGILMSGMGERTEGSEKGKHFQDGAGDMDDGHGNSATEYHNCSRRDRKQTPARILQGP